MHDIKPIIEALTASRPSAVQYIMCVVTLNKALQSNNSDLSIPLLAQMLNISTDELSAKLCGDDMFNAYELLTIQNILNE
jgi:hypothetical protein